MSQVTANSRTPEQDVERLQRELATERTARIRAEALLEACGEALYLVDGTGRVLAANGAAARSRGLTVPDLLATPVAAEGPSDLGVDLADVRRRGDVAASAEQRRGDGSPFPVEVHARTVEVEGQPAVVVAARDVTVRHRRLQAQRRSEEIAHALIHAAPAATMLLDVNGNIMALNPEAARTLGLPMDQLAGTYFADHLPEALRAPQAERLKDVVRTGRAQVVEDEQAGRHTLSTVYPVRDAQGAVQRVAVYSLDVTELRHAQERVRASEAELKSLLAAISDVILVVDREGRVVRVAPTRPGSMPEFRAKLEGHTLEQLYPPAAAAALQEAVRAALDSGQAVAVEPTPSFLGQSVWMETMVSPAGAEHAVLVSRDVTEHQVALEVLARSEEHFRALFESAPVGICIAQEGRLLLANREFLAMFGRAGFAEVVGSPLSQFLPSCPRCDGDDRGEPCSYETAACRLDGTPFGLQVDMSRLELPSGPARLAFIRDITARQRVEQELKDSEQRFRLLVNSLDDTVFTMDRQLRITGVFGRALERAGRTPESFLGQRLGELTGPTAAVHEQAFASALAGQPTTYGYPQAAPGGPRQFESSLSPLRDGAGTVVGLVGVTRDVSEQQRLRAQLQASDRLVSMGTLAAGVAHEINNPLAAATANLDHAARELAVVQEEQRTPGALSAATRLADIQEALEDARTATTQVRQIVRDLKVFSRPDEERRDPVDVRRVMESTLRMAWNEIRHRARLVKEYADIPAVLGTEARLGQVFLNLLVNAAQAIPEGQADRQVITVRTATDSTGRAVVEVEDTGTGIPAVLLPRLFEPFVTTKPAGVGTGLGLSICRRIITELGGEIGVRSTSGKGTVVRILLPAAAGPSHPATTRSTPPTSARRGRLLVVDDDPGILKALQRILRHHHDVTAVSGGRAALALLQAGPAFDLVLCDVMMPEMTGAELHAELLAHHPQVAARMVFLTGGAFTPAAREFLDRVPNPHVEKPFEAADLLALVDALLR